MCIEMASCKIAMFEVVPLEAEVSGPAVYSGGNHTLIPQMLGQYVNQCQFNMKKYHLAYKLTKEGNGLKYVFDFYH